MDIKKDGQIPKSNDNFDTEIRQKNIAFNNTYKKTNTWNYYIFYYLVIVINLNVVSVAAIHKPLPDWLTN